MKRVVFIGQAPARPGSKHGIAGTYIRPWLYQIGLTESVIVNYFRFYALTDSFPGNNRNGHLRPSPMQILEYRPTLIQHLQDFQPDVVVPVGAMAIKEVMPIVRNGLDDIIGKVYHVNPFESLEKKVVVIPWPHPSGRSTWLSANPDKTAQALQMLRMHLK